MTLVEIPELELAAIIYAVDAFLRDPVKGAELTKYGLTTNVDPWVDPTNTPYVTYFWNTVEFDETEKCAATFDILVIESAEKSEGAMHSLSNIVVDLWRIIRGANRIGIGAITSDGKAVRVSRIAPGTARFGTYQTKQGWKHAANLPCEVNFLLRSI